MYTLVLMSVLSSGGNVPQCGHNHQYGFRGWGGDVFNWNGWGCDWFPSGGWYGGGARGPNAWAAYGLHVNGGNTYNGYSAYPVEDFPGWNGYAGFYPGGGGGHSTPIMMCAYNGCPTIMPPPGPPPGLMPIHPGAIVPVPSPLPSPTKKVDEKRS